MRRLISAASSPLQGRCKSLPLFQRARNEQETCEPLILHRVSEAEDQEGEEIGRDRNLPLRQGGSDVPLCAVRPLSPGPSSVTHVRLSPFEESQLGQSP